MNTSYLTQLSVLLNLRHSYFKLKFQAKHVLMCQLLYTIYLVPVKTIQGHTLSATMVKQVQFIVCYGPIDAYTEHCNYHMLEYIIEQCCSTPRCDKYAIIQIYHNIP